MARTKTRGGADFFLETMPETVEYGSISPDVEARSATEWITCACAAFFSPWVSHSVPSPLSALRRLRILCGWCPIRPTCSSRCRSHAVWWRTSPACRRCNRCGNSMPCASCTTRPMPERARQLVAYYEKALGLPWPELLDRLAGGGIVAAVKFGPDPAPAVLVVQAKDQALLKRFAELALTLLEQEAVRQESHDRVVRSRYHGIETVAMGKQFHAAVAGRAPLVSNSKLALHLALDQYVNGGRTSLAHVAGVAAARKLLPAEPLIWFWSRTRAIHKAPQAKEIFTLPRNDANLTVAFGGLLDLLGRSPFICGSLSLNGNKLLLTAQLPRGREGMSPALTTHVPAAGQPGSLPLLEPPGVLLSESYYFDIGKFWENRHQLFNAKQVKTFEDFDKNTGKFLLGHRFSQLTNQLGPYQRPRGHPCP